MKTLFVLIAALTLSGCISVDIEPRKCAPGEQILIPNGSAGMIIRECGE